MKNQYILWMLAIFISGCVEDSPEVKAGRKAMVEHFKSDEEPTTKSASWWGSSLFAVGVINDQTNRDGYARYVCATREDFGLSEINFTIQVIDIAKLALVNEKVILGEHFCR